MPHIYRTSVTPEEDKSIQLAIKHYKQLGLVENDADYFRMLHHDRTNLLMGVPADEPKTWLGSFRLGRPKKEKKV